MFIQYTFSQVMFTQNILNLKIISLFVFQRKPLKIPTIFLFAAEKISFQMDKIPVQLIMG